MDFVARYGGEEFVVLLPETDAHGAYAVASNIFKAIERLEIPHEKSSVANTYHHQFRHYRLIVVKTDIDKDALLGICGSGVISCQNSLDVTRFIISRSVQSIQISQMA